MMCSRKKYCKSLWQTAFLPQNAPSRFKIHLPKTNSLPLKIGHPKRKLVFQPSFFLGQTLVSRRVFVGNCCSRQEAAQFHCQRLWLSQVLAPSGGAWLVLHPSRPMCWPGLNSAAYVDIIVYYIIYVFLLDTFYHCCIISYFHVYVYILIKIQASTYI